MRVLREGGELPTRGARLCESRPSPCSASLCCTSIARAANSPSGEAASSAAEAPIGSATAIGESWAESCCSSVAAEILAHFSIGSSLLLSLLLLSSTAESIICVEHGDGEARGGMERGCTKLRGLGTGARGRRVVTAANHYSDAAKEFDRSSTGETKFGVKRLCMQISPSPLNQKGSIPHSIRI